MERAWIASTTHRALPRAGIQPARREVLRDRQRRRERGRHKRTAVPGVQPLLVAEREPPQRRVAGPRRRRRRGHERLVDKDGAELGRAGVLDGHNAHGQPAPHLGFCSVRK
jgi:hypothetical protein